MRKGGTASALLVALLALAPSLALSSPSLEVEGNGEAQIVGDNLVSARGRALAHARRDAVARASATHLAPEVYLLAEARIRAEILPRAEGYIRTFRVLEERQDDRRFLVRIAATLHADRLLLDLQRLKSAGGASFEAQQAVSPDIRVRLRCPSDWPGPAASRLKQALALRLEALGFHSSFLASSDEWPTAVPEIQHLDLTLNALPAGSLPGLAWPGVGIEAIVRRSGPRNASSDDAAVATVTLTRWAAGKTRELAFEAALASTLTDILASVDRLVTGGSAALQHSSEPGCIGIMISGLSLTKQFKQVQDYLCRDLSWVSECRVSGLESSRADFRLRSSRPLADLAMALEQRQFSGFSLKSARSAKQSLWLRVEPEAMPAP